MPKTPSHGRSWGDAVKQAGDWAAPAFMVDCLETLEEIAITGRSTFLDAGGEWFHQIPCLNDQPPAIDFLAGNA